MFPKSKKKNESKIAGQLRIPLVEGSNLNNPVLGCA